MRRAERLIGESGVTMIESVVSLAILGVAFAVFIGGMFTSVLGSDVHRKKAFSETVIRQVADALKATTYVPCAGLNSYPPNSAPTTTVLGYNVHITNVVFWSGSDFSVTTCSTDPGLQKITLQVTSSDGRNTETVSIVKRQP